MAVDRVVCGDRMIWLGDGRIESPAGVHHLRPLEARLVRYLARADGRVVARAELLSAVWGYRPGVRSRTLDTTVKTIRQKLEADPARPRHLVTCRGEGYRLDAEVPQHDRLFGRDGDLRAIAGLRDARPGVLTLVGPPGVGKSRLAARVVGSRAPIVPLEAAVTRADLTAAVGGVLLGDRAADGPAVLRALRCTSLDAVLLDDADRLDTEARAQVAAWAGRGPLLLVTRRAALRVRGEHVHRVRPLGPADAEALFLDRVARRVRRPLADDHTLSELIRRLDGLPLALELAAARAPTMTLGGLLAALDDDLAVLADGPTDGPARHTSLERALAWSWTGLSPHHAAALAALSVFRGPFDLSEAISVAGVPTRVVLDLLDASLVSPHEGRLRLLHAIRTWAAARLAPDAAAAVRRRWARALADLCRAAAFDPAAALVHRTEELEDALCWALANDPVAAGPLAHAVLAAQYRSASASRTARWLDRIAAAAPLAPRWAVRVGFWRLAAACGGGDARVVVREGPRLVARARELGDPGAERLLCSLLGHASIQTDDLDAAERWYAAELAAARRHVDPRAVARSTLNHAKMLGARGDAEGRRRHLRQALHLLRLADDPVYQARAAGMLATSEVRRGRPDIARDLLARAIDDARGESVRLVGMLETALGDALTALGDRPGAIAALERAIRHAHATGDRNIAEVAAAALAALTDDAQARHVAAVG